MILRVVRIMGSQVTGGDWRSQPEPCETHTSKPLFLGGSNDSVLRVVYIMVTKLALAPTIVITWSVQWRSDGWWWLIFVKRDGWRSLLDRSVISSNPGSPTNRIFFGCWFMNHCFFTLPETNIFAPKNGWLEHYFAIGEAYFQGLC